jgi:hypothetical protein
MRSYFAKAASLYQGLFNQCAVNPKDAIFLESLPANAIGGINKTLPFKEAR